MPQPMIYGPVYAVLAVLAIAVARGHLRAARRAGVPALLFIGLVYVLEAVEIVLLLLAVLHVLPEAVTIAVVILARLITVSRFAFGQGMLVGATHGRLPIGNVKTVRDACRFVARGYGRWGTSRVRQLFGRRR